MGGSRVSLGWIEGQNVKVVSRWAEGRTERFTEIAAEFVTLKVDIIVTSGGGVPASKQATSVIPIVFALANDPVGTGYVASLSQPGGNITGLSAQSTDVVGKRLELLREVMPALGRLAIMGGPEDNRSVVLEMDEVRAAARTAQHRGRHIRKRTSRRHHASIRGIQGQSGGGRLVSLDLLLQI